VQALEITDTLVRKYALDVIVIHSVAALVSRSEIEGENGRCNNGSSGKINVAGTTQAYGGYFPNLKTSVDICQPARSKMELCFVILKTTGGNALKFYAS